MLSEYDAKVKAGGKRVAPSVSLMLFILPQRKQKSKRNL
jgi:hypothetical protein